MKTIFSLILLVSSSFMAGAQGFKDRYFSSIGMTPIFDFGAAPGEVIYPAIDNIGDTLYFLHQRDYLTLISLFYEGRYNIFAPSDNLAVSVKAKPTFNLNVLNGFGGFYFPIGIGLEIGNGATYQTSSNMGFTLTGGYTFNFFPLIEGDIFETAALYNVEIKKSWSCPYIAAGVRYWNKNNKLQEINILYGFAGANDEIPSDIQQVGFAGDTEFQNKKFDPAFMLCVSWMIYLNY